jgi:hypothetical protein
MKEKDIPKDLLSLIREKFDEDENVIKLRMKQQELMRKGLIREAMKIGEQVNRLFEIVCTDYLKEINSNVEKIELKKLGLSQDDKERIMTHCIVLFMACDIIESAVIDIDDVLHKHDKDLSFEMFNDFKKLKDLAKAKLEYLKKNGDYMQDVVWADKCDNMYELITNKAKSMVRKKMTTK